MSIRRQSTVLLLPVAIAWAVDVALTSSLQPAAYWAGEYAKAAEETVIFHLLLVQHPLLFFAGNGAYIAFWCLIIVTFRPRIGRYVAAVFVVGHAWGASTWLWDAPHASSLIFALQTSISLGLTACLERSIRWEQEAATKPAATPRRPWGARKPGLLGAFVP